MTDIKSREKLCKVLKAEKKRNKRKQGRNNKQFIMSREFFFNLLLGNALKLNRKSTSCDEKFLNAKLFVNL